MDIYVIDTYQNTEPHFPIVGIVPGYHSVIWNIQLYGLGYFELTVDASPENVAMLTVNRYLVRGQDIDDSATYIAYNNAMVIRSVNISYDADMGYLLKVTGKSVKDTLSQRIIWDFYEFKNANLCTTIWTLCLDNITEPDYYMTGKLNTWTAKRTEKMEERTEAQESLTEAMTVYEQAVEEHGEDSPEAKAAKEEVDRLNALIESLVEEVNYISTVIAYYRVQADVAPDRAIPWFNSGMVDLPFTPPRISAQLRGENLGTWVENMCTEYRIGWRVWLTDRSMGITFDKGEDRTGTVIFSPEFDNIKNSEYIRSVEAFRNAGLTAGEGTGIDQVVAPVGSATGINRFEEWISATDIKKDESTTQSEYGQMLAQYGRTAIIQYMKKASISGEVDTDGVFKIGEDFNLGDMVTIQTEQGFSADMRLIEIIEADEASGHSVTGTFEEWED